MSRSPLAHFPIDSRRSLFLTRMPLNVCIAFDIIMCVHSFLTLYAHGPLMLKRSRGHSEVLELKRQMAVKVKAQFRANEKSYQNPWCLHYAANYGDMERLGQLVAAMKEEAAGDHMVVRALADERDLDSGRTALVRGLKSICASLPIRILILKPPCRRFVERSWPLHSYIHACMHS